MERRIGLAVALSVNACAADLCMRRSSLGKVLEFDCEDETPFCCSPGDSRAQCCTPLDKMGSLVGSSFYLIWRDASMATVAVLIMLVILVLLVATTCFMCRPVVNRIRGLRDAWRGRRDPKRLDKENNNTLSIDHKKTVAELTQRITDHQKFKISSVQKPAIAKKPSVITRTSSGPQQQEKTTDKPLCLVHDVKEYTIPRPSFRSKKREAPKPNNNS